MRKCVSSRFSRKQNTYEVRVADNGVGFPKDLDFRRAQTMGLEIINALVSQIEGTIDLDWSRGTAFTIEFGEQAS